MISTFNDLIKAASEQEQPQRLLLLFASAETDATKQNGREQQGTLSPLMCVDKLPEEIESFKALAEEADDISKEWDLILAAGLSGQNGEAPSSDDAEPFLNQMADNLASGQDLSQYVVFDREGNPVVIQSA